MRMCIASDEALVWSTHWRMQKGGTGGGHQFSPSLKGPCRQNTTLFNLKDLAFGNYKVFLSCLDKALVLSASSGLFSPVLMMFHEVF